MRVRISESGEEVDVRGVCRRCFPREVNVDLQTISLVSPRGIAHAREDEEGGQTRCDIRTDSNWWLRAAASRVNP